MRAGRQGMRERFRRRGSIVGDLAVMVLVTLLPLVILGGYLSYRAVRDERAEIAATAQRQARETAQRADAIVAETRTRLTILAQTPTLREADPARARALLADVDARFPYYDDLFAVDAAGTVYASVARR